MTTVQSITNISLTPLGKKKVEDMSGKGPAFSVMGHLYNSGGMTLSDLEAASNMNKGRLVGIIRLLHKEGYATVTKTSEGIE